MSASGNLSGQQFTQFVERVHQTGGATMSLQSGKLLNPGKRAYLVGGEPDSTGVRIPTQRVPVEDFQEKHVQEMTSELLRRTGGRGKVNLGAWSEDGHVEMDASSSAHRPGEAVRKGRNRGEKAIWDNKHMREIDTGGRGK